MMDAMYEMAAMYEMDAMYEIVQYKVYETALTLKFHSPDTHH
jgi:hypothetical protein